MSKDANSWRWSATGATSRTGYESFYSGEPNNQYIEYCGMMYNNGLWNDKSCNTLNSFICYTGKKKIINGFFPHFILNV